MSCKFRSLLELKFERDIKNLSPLLFRANIASITVHTKRPAINWDSRIERKYFSSCVFTFAEDDNWESFEYRSGIVVIKYEYRAHTSPKALYCNLCPLRMLFIVDRIFLLSCIWVTGSLQESCLLHQCIFSSNQVDQCKFWNISKIMRLLKAKERALHFLKFTNCGLHYNQCVWNIYIFSFAGVLYFS